MPVSDVPPPHQTADEVVETALPRIPTHDENAPRFGRRGVWTKTLAIFPMGHMGALDQNIALRVEALSQCVFSVTFGESTIGSTAEAGPGWRVDRLENVAASMRVEVKRSASRALSANRAPFLDVRGTGDGLVSFRLASSKAPSVEWVRRRYKR